MAASLPAGGHDGVLAVFVHGFNAHRWSLGKGYGGEEGPLARVYCYADGPPRGAPRVGSVFGKLPELFQGGKGSLMVAYRCTHEFVDTSRAVADAIYTALDVRGRSLADTVIITHSMGGLVMSHALQDLLDAEMAELGADQATLRDAGADEEEAASHAATEPPRGASGGAARLVRLPRALIMLDTPFNGLSDAASVAADEGARLLASRAGAVAGRAVATGGGAAAGSAGAIFGAVTAMRAARAGSWAGALLGGAAALGLGAAAVWAATSEQVGAAGESTGRRAAEEAARYALGRTRRFADPVIRPLEPSNAAVLRRCRRAVLRLGCWIPVLVMACTTPEDEAGAGGAEGGPGRRISGVSQAGFRSLPPDEAEAWAALSASHDHMLCVQQVVPQRFRALLMPAEEGRAMTANERVESSGLIGRLARGPGADEAECAAEEAGRDAAAGAAGGAAEEAGRDAAAGAAGGTDAHDVAPAWNSNYEGEEVGDAGVAPVWKSNREEEEGEGEAGGGTGQTAGAADAPETDPSGGTPGGMHSAPAGAAPEGTTARPEASAKGGAAGPRHRRARSDGGASAAAASSALVAFNAAGESAAKAERSAGPLGELELSQAGVRLAEGWVARLVRWAVTEAAKEEGDEGPGADVSFATLIAHVMDHSSVFREAEQFAFVATTLDSLPLEDTSAPVAELLALHREARAAAAKAGVDASVEW